MDSKINHRKKKRRGLEIELNSKIKVKSHKFSPDCHIKTENIEIEKGG